MVSNREKLNAISYRNTAAQRAASFLRRPAPTSGFAGNCEPTLDDLLTDPILHRLLASDGVRSDHLVTLIADVKGRLASR